jgi:exodeoxyribonuclease V alpha subunit
MAKRHCDSVIEDENAKLAAIGPNLKLQEKQVKAIRLSVGSAVSCIIGGAGTGKTTVLKSVLAVYKKMGYTIKTMALSARAAMRAQECIESLDLIATSIAKFLHESPLENSFEKYLVVIDEASMLDLPTMYRIVINTDPRVRFLLVGDPEQLPPIGCGKILADIIQSDIIPFTELDIVQRQDESTGIPLWADFVKRGVVPPKLSTANVHFHNVDFADVSKKCAALYALAPAASRVIASTNALVDEINRLCQPECGTALSGYSKTIYLNDPILFTENNYDEEVQNGTLGKLTAVEPQGIVQIDGTEKEVCLTPELLTMISPAYALTAHKAQGSQFKRVIVAMSPGNNIDRSWFYTSITRAEVELHIVCTKQKLFSAITNANSASKRKTNLVPLLQAKS